MVILDIIAVDFAMIGTLLFAEMILAVGFLQFGVPFVFFVFEDIQQCTGMPFAAYNVMTPSAFSSLAITKLPLPLI